MACGDVSGLSGLTTPTRNRYFYGKLLDVFHLDLEQRYLNRKRWFLNRLVTGHGVVCGLSVAPTNDGSRVVVAPGLALDGFGREIVVPAPSAAVDPRQPTDACGKPVGDPLGPGSVVTLCLAFHECLSDPVPALVCDCDSDMGCEASSVRERYMILVREGPAPDVGVSCGMPELFDSTPPGELSYPTLVDRITQACPDGGEGGTEDGVEDGCVVLAEVTLPAADEAITAEMIDLDVRPVVYNNRLLFEALVCLAGQGDGGGPGGEPPEPETLTNVQATSWEHAGELTVSEFMGGLKIGLSAPVASPEGPGGGWLIVTVESPERETGSIVSVRALPRALGVAGDTVSFEPSGRFRAILDSLTEPVLCRVVLKCDVLLDEEGRAVDGDFLGGRLPSGNGIPGGSFESWFHLRF